MAYERISDANEITARYMDSILIEERLIDSKVADISTTVFGETFDMPIIPEHLSSDDEYVKYLAVLKERLKMQ